jgi:hypothetical protein
MRFKHRPFDFPVLDVPQLAIRIPIPIQFSGNFPKFQLSIGNLYRNKRIITIRSEKKP